MNRVYLIISCLACFFSLQVVSLNAPVTTAGTVLNATTTTGGVTIPVIVSNFIDIGNFTLTLNYTSSSITCQGCTANPAFTGISINTSTPGIIVVTWTGNAGITLPDNAHLLDISFTYISGTGYLTWDTTATVCSYTKYSSGSFLVLTDTPKASYYLDGAVTGHPAPFTYAPLITNASPGTVYLPITVKNFTDIGALTLTMEYNSNVLAYLNDFTPNAAFTVPPFTVGSQTGPGGIPVIVIGWSGSNVSLADGDTLVTLKFSYANIPGNGNFSQLTWFDNGTSCEYTDANAIILYDSPVSGFYKDGLVTQQVAPSTSLPVIVPATPGDSISVPVSVNNFTNISAISLNFEYDPSVMTYGSYTKNPLLNSGIFLLNNIVPGGGVKNILVLGWTGSSTSLSNGSAIATIRFHYSSGTSLLRFATGQDSCEYADSHNNALYQLPFSSYYQDGLVSNHVAPVTKTDSIIGAVGQSATVHVKVAHFSNIGAFTLTMNYDPGAVTYQSASPLPALGGSFTALPVEPGQLVFGWSGGPVSLPDSSSLFIVTFTENGGSSSLAWWTDGSACEYSEGGISPALYDFPKSNYYYNGRILPFGADFSASTITPDVDSTVIFTDLSIGSPVSWNWSFSPGTVVYLNGTDSTTPSPQVKFTASGLYSVTLIVSKGSLSSTKIKTNYIHAGTPGLWTGITTSNWGTASNWDNWLVPVSSTNVTIPSSAPFWPVYGGDLTLGTQCKNITMNGSSQFFITGNLTLASGTSLNITEDGYLKIGGNWNNSGLFHCGIGTVEFTGPFTGIISGGFFPAGFLSNYSRSTFPVGMIFISGTPTGLTGDNAHLDLALPFMFKYVGAPYTVIRINTNGWISLNHSGGDPTSGNNSLLFSSPDPNTTLAPWWDDLITDSSTSISYSTSGSSPNRIFTIEWKNISSYVTGASAHLNFQVKLYETSNIIEFCYGSVGTGLHNSFESASIGIEDLTGGSGHFIEATTGSMTSGITNLTSTLNWPAVNYRFTPPPSTETFYNLIESKTAGTSLSIQRNIIVNGSVTLK